MLIMYVFYLIIFLLPNNLGNHFVARYSYVNGLLVDYLIPTLYVQDILVFLLIIFLLFLQKKKTLYSTLHKSWFLRIILVFFISLYLSVLVSSIIEISLFTYARMFLYAVFSIIIALYLDIHRNWQTIIKILAVSTFLLCVLALAQWFLQGSVFNNYLVFGEQPYNFSTYGISKESFFGKTVIPPYGLFRHPNILAGYLSIIFLWMLTSLGMISINFRKFFIFTMLLELVVIFLTMSFNAFFSLFAGLLVFIFARVFSKTKTQALILLLLLFFTAFAFSLGRLSLFFPEEPSLYRRVDLVQTAEEGIRERSLFGYGLGTGAKISGRDFQYLDAIRYPQPVHNIFILMFLEGGFFSFLLYVFIFLFLIFRSSGARVSIFSITFLQFAILGMFDHYVLTMHQTNLLFWLTVSFYSAYNYTS